MKAAGLVGGAVAVNGVRHGRRWKVPVTRHWPRPKGQP